MITKLYCWLFGHKLTMEMFTGEYGEVFNPLMGAQVKVPVVNVKRLEFCLRCGWKESKPEPATCGCQHCN